MNTALIDIDGTLFNSNSTFDFLDTLPHGRWYKYYKKISFSILGRIINKLSIITLHKDVVRIIGISCLKGYSRKQLIDLGEKFYEDFLESRKNDEVFDILESTKGNGTRIVLASATLDFLSEIICRRVGASAAIATELYYEDDLCLGTIAKDRLGHKKTALIESGVSFPVDLIITDNVTDAALLPLCRYKVIIVYPRERKKWGKILEAGKYQDVKFICYE